MDTQLRDQLLRFEHALATRDPTGIEGGLMGLIADDFVEFGRSGRVWTRDAIREALEGPSSPVSTDQAVDGFEVAELTDGVVLVTYRGPTTNRSSIWVRRDGRWQMRFHQGSAISAGSGRAEHPGDQATGQERKAE